MYEEKYVGVIMAAAESEEKLKLLMKKAKKWLVSHEEMTIFTGEMCNVWRLIIIMAKI
jgi:hypothetical protein